MMRVKLWSVLGGSLLVGAFPAFAQTAATKPNPEEAESEEAIVGQIVVTAQRREQTLLDVPIAVSVISGDLLDKTQSTNIEDVQRLVPSVTVGGAISPTGNSIRIRGVGTNVFSVTVEPSVSLVIDGIALPRNDAGLVELADIERIEVLKGPQGTLFGKNASAGVISYTTKRPSPELEGEVRARGTFAGDYRFDATISDSLGDKAGFRLTAFVNETADFIRNGFNNTGIGSQLSYGARAKLLLEPSDKVTIELASDYYKLEAECCGTPVRSLAGGNLPVIATGIQPSPRNRTVFMDRNPFNTMEQWGLSADISIDLGPVKLTSLTGYRDWKTGGELQDIDFFGSNGANAPVVGGISLQQQAFQQAKTFSQEFRLTPQNPGAIDYVVGLFYYNNSLDRFFDRDLGQCRAPTTPVGATCTNVLNVDSFFTLNVDVENVAVFGDATIDLTDRLALVVGARALKDLLKFNTSTSAGFVGGDVLKDEELIGRVGFRYDLSDRMAAFATYSRGYKAGAFDATISINTAVLSSGPVAPEKSDAFEFGLRGNPFGTTRLFMDFSLFHNTYTDFHAQAFDPNGAGASRLLNVGKTVTRGAELAIDWRPVEGLSISGNAQYLDAFFDDFAGAPCFAGQTAEQGCPTIGGRRFQDVSGETLPNAPRWKFAFIPRYEFSLENEGRLFVQSVFSYQSDVQFTIEQDPKTVQEAYALVDLSAGYIAPEGRWRATIFARNLFDQFFVNSIAGTFVNAPNGTFHVVPRNAERIVGAELAFRF